MKHTDDPIIVEVFLQASSESVWNALTDIREMEQWYFDNIGSFEPVVGFETQFPVTSEDRVFTHCWKILEVVDQKKLSYTWKFLEYPGDGVVTFELQELPNGTILRLILVVTEDYPSEIPEFNRKSCIGGWNYFLRDRLQEYLKDTAPE